MEVGNAVLKYLREIHASHWRIDNCQNIEIDAVKGRDCEYVDAELFVRGLCECGIEAVKTAKIVIGSVPNLDAYRFTQNRDDLDVAAFNISLPSRVRKSSQESCAQMSHHGREF